MAASSLENDFPRFDIKSNKSKITLTFSSNIISEELNHLQMETDPLIG